MKAFHKKINKINYEKNNKSLTFKLKGECIMGKFLAKLFTFGGCGIIVIGLLGKTLVENFMRDPDGFIIPAIMFGISAVVIVIASLIAAKVKNKK